MLTLADSFWGTHTGRQRRHNEDSYYAKPPIFVIADGMGGAQAGEVASAMAVAAFKAGLPPEGSAEEKLAAIIQQANQRIHATARSDRDRAGMGTTIAAAYLQPEEDEVAIAHVGDARAYRMRDGELEPLTHDHTLVQALIDQGRITPEEAAVHPQRSIITRAVGPEPVVDVETHTFALQPGDVVLLCSDGLTSMVGDETVRQVMRDAADLETAGHGLIEAANAAGGRDNITVILFRLGADGEDEAAPATSEETGAIPPVADPGATFVQPPSGEPVAQRDPKPATAFLPALSAADAAEPAPAERATRRLTPRRPGEAAPPAATRTRRRRRRRWWIPTTVVVVLLALLAGGLWLATRDVYFIATDSQGFVTIYRGLPWDLPAGLDLYERFYTSGVPAEIVPPPRRKTLLNHKLRSRVDVESLIDQLELGKLTR